MADRNMYGVTPCPRCDSKYRYPATTGTTQCDDCGYSVPHIVKRDGYEFDDAPDSAGRDLEGRETTGENGHE